MPEKFKENQENLEIPKSLPVLEQEAQPLAKPETSPKERVALYKEAADELERLLEEVKGVEIVGKTEVVEESDEELVARAEGIDQIKNYPEKERKFAGLGIDQASTIEKLSRLAKISEDIIKQAEEEFLKEYQRTEEEKQKKMFFFQKWFYKPQSPDVEFAKKRVEPSWAPDVRNMLLEKMDELDPEVSNKRLERSDISEFERENAIKKSTVKKIKLQ